MVHNRCKTGKQESVREPLKCISFLCSFGYGLPGKMLGKNIPVYDIYRSTFSMYSFQENQARWMLIICHYVKAFCHNNYFNINIFCCIISLSKAFTRNEYPSSLLELLLGILTQLRLCLPINN